MIFSLILPMSSFMPIFIAIIHFQPPYNANKYILVSGALRAQLLCCAHAIPKPTMPFCRQHPNTPSCRFSLQSFTSSQNNLRISAFWRASCAITCAARAIPKPTTPFCQQRPCPPSCQFSLQSFTSSYHKLRISAFWRASRTITCGACARSQNQQRHFVSNAHVPLHADFHCNPSLLATINSK